jgi:hypothetical protein
VGEHRRFLTLAGLVALVVVLVGAIWTLSAEPPPLGVCRLPDGSVLRLDAVTVGPEHQFVMGRYGQRLLAALLPPGLTGSSGATITTYHSINPPAIIFWTSRPGVPNPMYGFGVASRTVVLDGHGNKVRAAARPIDIPVGFRFRPGPRKGLVKVANEFVRGYALPAFPRRGRTVTLRISGYNPFWKWVPLAGRRHGRRAYSGPGKWVPNWVPVAEFTVPNPDPGPHPVWRPEPLPITKRSGDLDFTLSRLVAEADPPSVAPSFSMPEVVFQVYPHSWTRADFRISRKGKPAPEWEAVGMTLSDASGNVMTPALPVYYPQAGEAHFAFPSGLPPDEAAWKVRAEFVPTAGFAPADLWTVRGVAAPKGWNAAPSSASATRHGARLDLTLRVRRLPVGGSLVVEPQVAPEVDGLRVGLVRASDDREQMWTPVTRAAGMAFLPAHREVDQHQLDVITPNAHLSDSTSWRPPEPGRAYELRVPADVRTLALTFAVVKSRFVEFMVRPSRG